MTTTFMVVPFQQEFFVGEGVNLNYGFAMDQT